MHGDVGSTQLSVASWWILDSTFIRAIHLAFALLICFLEYPFRRSGKGADGGPFGIDVVLALLAGLSALYLALDYGGIVQRYGAPIFRDLVMGMLLVVLLIEATQGWFAARNRWYECLLLLCVTDLMLRPDAVAAWWGMAHGLRYWVCLPGLALYAGVFLWQRRRAGCTKLRS